MGSSLTNVIPGPHQTIRANLGREQFALQLFDALWERYRERVSYVRTYESLIRDAGATFVNDHIAFRTLANQNPLTGISSLSRIFEALGYRPAGVYDFPDKHLNAIHFQHPHAEFPKLFISELKTWELSGAARETIERTLATHRPSLPLATLAALVSIEQETATVELMDQVLCYIQDLPWELPERTDVEAINAESQYAAWVLVHGYNVNHFTSLVNSHGVATLGDLEKTIAALRAAQVPMKAEIEGERGSKLRQSATEAVRIEVDVKEHGRRTSMPWSYAYFELAERNPIKDPRTGQAVRFEGFLGPQATQLFEMTRLTK